MTSDIRVSSVRRHKLRGVQTYTGQPTQNRASVINSPMKPAGFGRKISP
jgi:hypothetical protein